jgi:hypothetical protein
VDECKPLQLGLATSEVSRLLRERDALRGQLATADQHIEAGAYTRPLFGSTQALRVGYRVGYRVLSEVVKGLFGWCFRVIRGFSGVYVVSEPAQVELRSGRV